jgi:hypothetical protein
MDFVSMITNLSMEYPVFLETILWMFAVVGVLISANAVISIIKLGKRDHGLVTPGAHIGWKMFGGASLVQLSLMAKAWCGTLWQESGDLGISQYSGAGGNWDAAINAAVGIMVLAGWVTLGRAYVMVTKLGTVSIEARGDLVGSIAARIVAGTALICTIHVASAIGASTGFKIT